MTLRETDRLYLIADASRAHRSLERIVEEAVEAGVRLVQLRAKAMSDADYRALARRLRTITREHGARLLLNGRVPLVEDVGADGVHLPAAESIRDARRILGPEALIGYSAHDGGELRRAASEGADFVTLSPIFRTVSKPGASALGLDRFRALLESFPLPVYALGGITPERTRDVLEAGAFGVAVLGGIVDAADVEEAVRAYCRALELGRRQRHDQG